MSCPQWPLQTAGNSYILSWEHGFTSAPVSGLLKTTVFTMPNLARARTHERNESAAQKGQTDVKHHRFIEAAVLDKQPSATVVPGQIRRIIMAYWSEAVIIVVAFLLWVPRFSGPIDLRWDAGVYYLLGTSLANGQGYRIQSEPGSPEALQYPPLLPAVVALHERVVGTNDPAVVAPLLRIMYAVVF